MINFSKKINILPRWIIAFLDGFIMFQCVVLAFWLRANFDWVALADYPVGRAAAAYLLIGSLVMFFTKSYVGIVRHTSLSDGLLLMRTTAATGVIAFLCDMGYSVFLVPGKHFLPLSVLVIASVLTLSLLMVYRLFVKEVFRFIKNNGEPNLPEKDVLIFGAGEAGILIHNAILKNSHYKFNVHGFLDDDASKRKKKIEGMRVHGGLEMLDTLVKEKGVKELIISVLELSPARKREIIDRCITLNIHALTITPVNEWVDGGAKQGSIREVNIEDLLSRDAIMLKNKNVASYFSGKTILVTGAAGSIGSEICKQVARANPGFLIMLDKAESPLHDQEIRLESEFEDLAMQTVLADVTDEDTLDHLMKTYRPEVIFHAAAYKHVPMMERYPAQAVRCNVLGTKTVADLAVKYGVEKFVLVSTDKAVNPTNVMGASKRIAEMYIQSLDKKLRESNQGGTRFITTRFGNVLGSNGSVIPLFKEQIKKGGPLTVTDAAVTRYFMTIPEACDLVLEAGVMGNGGEIFVFDMGEPVKIIDLARKMIHLSGKKPDVDIMIRITGLRPGEKLYEEVLNDQEKTIETHHAKIQIAQVRPGVYKDVNLEVALLLDMEGNEGEMTLVGQMKKLVPEFLSHKSRFEAIDQKAIAEEIKP
ncbi:polysaccharide biosynthesis protein [Cyclobacterium qasimii]|uniref:Capsular polysaccharide biosynthesis protein n=2 Tax=Cyclobacterium qasimii TaxID=1350429 RepID=A0A512C9E8_9BACT|nr:nucleoside-diphosphate sugar epimerase/dehydratase [Cyclobacterium qasimii]GEO20757.1 capsular polysaccharide biosynthesis protein [Cyclobacterium qasimii]